MNQSDHLAQLDAPPKTIWLSSPVDPSSMTFLYRGQTQGQVVAALYALFYTPETPANRVWLALSEIEVISTFLVCSYMLFKKKSLGKLWIFTRRRTAYGTFYVANAVFVLVLGVAAYLFAWNTLAIVVSAFSFANLSSLEWWWIIPLPWLPLVLGAYVSIHGFAIGCSPKSPLSTINTRMPGVDNKKWYYVPIAKSAFLVNTILILPCVVFTASTFFLVVMSGRAYYRAVELRRLLIPREIDELINLSAHHPVTFATQDVLASDELLWAARRVCAAFLESHRYVCINLVVFAAAGSAILIPCLVYGQPNIMGLVDHACSRHPKPLPPTCTTFLRKTWFLLTLGRPRSDHSSEQIDLNTWKMTILAIVYMYILIVCVPAFVSVPIFVVAMSFPHEMLKGDITPSFRAATIAISLITILSCTFVAVFCIVATLDPLFRQAIGLSVIRTQVPVDVKVVRSTQMQVDDEPFTPVESEEGRRVKFKQSSSTLKCPSYSPGDWEEADQEMEVGGADVVHMDVIAKKSDAAADGR